MYPRGRGAFICASAVIQLPWFLTLIQLAAPLCSNNPSPSAPHWSSVILFSAGPISHCSWTFWIRVLINSFPFLSLSSSPCFSELPLCSFHLPKSWTYQYLIYWRLQNVCWHDFFGGVIFWDGAGMKCSLASRRQVYLAFSHQHLIDSMPDGGKKVENMHLLLFSLFHHPRMHHRIACSPTKSCRADCNDWKMKWRSRVEAEPESITGRINMAFRFAWSH